MKPLEKRIERIEKAWLPKKINPIGMLSLTMEELTFLVGLPKAFPEPGTMPKFLQAELSKINEHINRPRYSATPQSDESTDSPDD